MGRSLADDSGWAGKGPEYREFYGDIEEIKRKYAPRVIVEKETPREKHNYHQKRREQTRAKETKARLEIKPPLPARAGRERKPRYFRKTLTEVPEGYVAVKEVSKQIKAKVRTVKLILKELGVKPVQVWREFYCPFESVPAILEARASKGRSKPRYKPEEGVPDGWLRTSEIAKLHGMSRRAVQHYLKNHPCKPEECHSGSRGGVYYSPEVQARYRAYKHSLTLRVPKVQPRKTSVLKQEALMGDGWKPLLHVAKDIRTPVRKLRRTATNLKMGLRVGTWVMLSPEEQATLTKLFDGWRNQRHRP